MSSIFVQTKGMDNVRKKMAKRGYKIKHPKKANKAAALMIFNWIQRNFQREGGLHDKGTLKWAPLSDRTIKQRRGKGKGAKILQDTGALKGRWDRKANDKYGAVISRTPYAAQHEYGFRPKHIPQRKILPTIKQGEKIATPVYIKAVKEWMKA